jgi:predicted deacetylase
VTARLVVSLSGITARTLHRCAELAGELDRRGVPLSLLLTPGALSAGPVLEWVRGRHTAGDALLLHGCDHLDSPRRRAEFATLPAHEAGLRLTAAVATLDRVELRPDGFAPPRWLASPGTLTALRRKDFRLCADLGGVRELRTGNVHRGRVLGIGSGTHAEPWWCFALVLGAARAARRGGLVRVAVDAPDLARPGPRQALLDAVDIATHHGAARTTYRGLLTPVSARPAAATP